MKRFKFTLQSLYNYKQTVERLQKAELKRAQQALQELLDEEKRLLRAYADNERSLEIALRRGENMGKIRKLFCRHKRAIAHQKNLRWRKRYKPLPKLCEGYRFIRRLARDR